MGRSQSGSGTILLWLRRDLRLHDHSAWRGALEAGKKVIPVYIWDPAEEDPWPLGGASRWWLQRSLAALSEAITARGSRLILRRGEARKILPDLARSCNSNAVYLSRRYEPLSCRYDEGVREACSRAQIYMTEFGGSLIREPSEVSSGSGGPYQVYSPFARRWREGLLIPEPLAAPRQLPAVPQSVESEDLDDLGILPVVPPSGKPWWIGMEAMWEPGERGARAALRHFLGAGSDQYDAKRDQMGITGTSHLSPHLHFGEITPAAAWRAVVEVKGQNGGNSVGAARAKFGAELIWREFAAHLLHHFPETLLKPLRREFEAFPWSVDPSQERAWQLGQTGYPVVDAGMRELWQTGWMHNRARMIVASFLVKDLRQSWTRGAQWFWNTLVDADWASNTLGWQWAAGCGADAAPYFRVFNPVLQGRKFDPEGTYVRRFVPELAALPSRWIHEPWAAPAPIMREAGVTLGVTYPHPIVDHGRARFAALKAYDSLKKKK